MFLQSNLFVLTILSFVAIACAIFTDTKTPGQLIAQTAEGLLVTITGKGNVPKMEIALNKTDAASDRYKLQLTSFYQLNAADDVDKGKLPSTTIAAASMGWNVGAFQSTPDGKGIEFNMTSVGSIPSFTFQFHIADGNEVAKFDVLISGVIDAFWADGQGDPNKNGNYLAMCFKLIQQGKGQTAEADASVNRIDLDTSQNKDKLRFGSAGSGSNVANARFSSVRGATVADKTIAVRLVQEGGNKNGACIIYEKFTGSLEHDPALGLDYSSNEGVQGFVIFLIIVLIIGIVSAFIAAAVVGGVIIARRRKAQQQLLIRDSVAFAQMD